MDVFVWIKKIVMEMVMSQTIIVNDIAYPNSIKRIQIDFTAFL